MSRYYSFAFEAFAVSLSYLLPRKKARNVDRKMSAYFIYFFCICYCARMWAQSCYVAVSNVIAVKGESIIINTDR